MARYEFITKESMLDYYLTNKPPGFSYQEDSLFQYMDAAVDAVMEADLYEALPVLMELDNYQAELPRGFSRVVQVLFKPYHTGKQTSRYQITELTRDLFGSHGCKLKIEVECPKCTPQPCICKTSVIKLEDAEAEFRFPELMANLTRATRVESTNPESPFFTHFHNHDKRWRMIRPAQNHFFAHTYHIGDCIDFHIETEIEYLIAPPVIRVNAKGGKGQILMACLLHRVDRDGYRLIPNTPIVLRLVDMWIEAEMARSKWIREMKPEYERLWNGLEQHRLSLLRIARAEINGMDPDEQEAYVENFYRKWVNPVDHMHNLGRRMPEKFQFKR